MNRRGEATITAIAAIVTAAIPLFLLWARPSQQSRICDGWTVQAAIVQAAVNAIDATMLAQGGQVAADWAVIKGQYAAANADIGARCQGGKDLTLAAKVAESAEILKRILALYGLHVPPAQAVMRAESRMPGPAIEWERAIADVESLQERASKAAAKVRP